MGRAGAWTGLVAGVAIMIVAVVALNRPGPPDEFGNAPQALGAVADTTSSTSDQGSDDPDQDAMDEDEAGDSSSPSTSPAASDDQSATSGPPSTTGRSARIADVQARSTPTEVRIDGLGITAPIDPVGTLDDGTMEIPEDVRRAGWFRHGTSPGEPTGSVVVTAHVDSRTQGRGAFFPLRDAQPGELVEMDTDSGTVVYEVTSLRRYYKAELPVFDLFRMAGEHQLVLITCGGDFDPATRSYEENVVVFAEPVA